MFVGMARRLPKSGVLANIRLGWVGMPGTQTQTHTHTQTYLAHSQVMMKKGFGECGPGDRIHNSKFSL
jgi:hypothetical protein